MSRDARDADKDIQGKDSAASDDPNTDAWGQKGTPGMIGSGGSMANVDVGQYGSAPVGTPETPGTVASPGTGVNIGDMGDSSMGRTNRVLGSPGNVGSPYSGNAEPATPGVPGTPTPTPIPGAGAPEGIASPDPDMPTSLGADSTGIGSSAPSGGDPNARSSYGRSGTPGLGGARTSGGPGPDMEGDTGAQPRGDDEGNSTDSGDAHSQRSAGAANESAGSGIQGLGGSQGGTQNYGGVGVPGGASTLGGGRTGSSGQPSPTSGVPATGGASGDTNAERNQGPVYGATVLPGGATRPNGLSDGEPGDIQMKDGADYQTRTSGQGAPTFPGADSLHGTGAGGAANDVARGGAEAATIERHGERPTIAGSPAPMTAPPAPQTENPFGGTQSESAANPLQEGEIPQQPTPGVTHEPGPQAQP